MPIVSKAQQRWAYANQGDRTREGAAARDFIAATPKSAYKKLPARKKKKVRSFGSLAPGR
jgi:hypothetical protein